VTGIQAHRSYLELGAVPGAVPQARRFTRRTLAAWRLDRIADDTALVVSELVTNAVAASGMAPAAQVALYLALDLDRLFILVWDGSPRQPEYRGPAGEYAETGRGLGIVSAIADRWGTVTLGAGKIVWAQLALTRRNAAS